MTQEDKSLLLQDLCARLPYWMMIHITDDENHLIADEELYCINICQEALYTRNREFHDASSLVPIEYCKPYLRPISTMTEEEMDMLFDILRIDKDGNDEDWIKINDDTGIKFFFPTGKWIENVAEAYDYLYSIHIDFRGLIHKGLALEALKNMYNVK